MYAASSQFVVIGVRLCVPLGSLFFLLLKLVDLAKLYMYSGAGLVPLRQSRAL
jgi:hypothetical protein